MFFSEICIFSYIFRIIFRNMSKKYEDLIKKLNELIVSSLDTGTRMLPSERSLAEMYGVSRQTVRTALLDLESRSLIKRIHGSGAHLTGILPDSEKNIIALLVASDLSYIFPAMISEISRILESIGFTLEVYTTGDSAEKEREILLSLKDRAVRGIIVSPIRSNLASPNYDVYQQLSSMSVPIVFFHGYYPNLSNMTYVKDDNYAGGYMLGEYLQQQGHSKIAGIFQIDNIQGQERYLGFARSLIEGGGTPPDNSTLWFTGEQLKMLDRNRDTGFLVDFIKYKLSDCTAVVCYNDQIAYWLLKELGYSSVRVPSDLGIVSFDNSYLSEMADTKITSLTHSANEMAASVCMLITEIIKGRNPSPMSLSWKLVDRGSVLPLN